MKHRYDKCIYFYERKWQLALILLFEKNNDDIFVVRSESLINFLIAGNIFSLSLFASIISFCTRCASILENLSAKLEHPLRMISMYSAFFRF